MIELSFSLKLLNMGQKISLIFNKFKRKSSLSPFFHYTYNTFNPVTLNSFITKNKQKLKLNKSIVKRYFGLVY